MAWEPNYITNDAFKHYLRINGEDIEDDIELSLAVTAASRAVDSCCSYVHNGLGAFRQFGKTDAPESRYYTPRWDDTLIRWVIEIDDYMGLAEDLTVVVDTTNSDVYNEPITQFVLRPVDAAQRNRPYTQIAVSRNSAVQPTFFKDSAKVTADVWGWTAFPATVVEATQIQAHRFFKRRTAPFGVTGSTGSPSTRESVSPKEADPDVKMMLSTYQRLGWTI